MEKKLKNKSFSNLQSNRCSRKIFFNRTGDLYDIRPSIQDGETPNKSITVFIFGMRIVDIVNFNLSCVGVVKTPRRNICINATQCSDQMDWMSQGVS